MSKYTKHVFFCTNQAADNKPCCTNSGSRSKQKYAKERLKALGLHGPGKVRINRAGCLRLCEKGPVLVIYPEGTWYRYVDQKDIDEIVDKHILEGKVVERLIVI